MVYTNECCECGHEWDSDFDDEPCPECDETENIETEINDVT